MSTDVQALVDEGVEAWNAWREANPTADLDEAALRAMAEQTGGRYFRARETGELEAVYAMLDEVELCLVAVQGIDDLTIEALETKAALFASRGDKRHATTEYLRAAKL